MTTTTTTATSARPAAFPGSATLRAAGRGLALPAVLVAAWSAALHLDLVDGRILVPPEDVLAAAFGEHAGHVWQGLWASFLRTMTGYGLGCAAGVALGTLLGLSRLADRMIGPSFHAVRQVALFAWVPLLTAWFGTGEQAKVAFITLAAFYPTVLNTQEGVTSVSRAYLEVARVFRLSRRDLLLRVVLPAATPSILIGLQLAMIYAWIATIGAEYLMGLGLGIGTVLNEAREHFRMELVLLGVVIIGLVGFVMNRGLGLVSKRLLRWRSVVE